MERQVTLGSLCTRGPFPESAWPGALEALKSQLSDMPLPPGTHGMSYFAYRSPGQPAVVDVSSNGISYGSLDVPLLAQAWPEAGSYYSARMFCIIAGAPGA